MIRSKTLRSRNSDLKPQNVLLKRRPNSQGVNFCGFVKLSDFGYSIIAHNSAQEGNRVGTRSWYPIEYLQNF